MSLKIPDIYIQIFSGYLLGVGWPIVCPGLTGFQGCWTFSAGTREILCKLRQLVNLLEGPIVPLNSNMITGKITSLLSLYKSQISAIFAIC